MSDAAERCPLPSATPDAAEAEKLKFLGKISHEIKTPLNSILGFANLIEVEALGPLGDTGYKDFAQEIQTSGKSPLKLVNELIAVAQTEAGANAKPGDVDLVIDGRRVSRPHARLVRIDGQFHLVDESLRGSFIVNADGDPEHVTMNVSAPLSGV